MAIKVITKLLYRKNRFLSLELRRMRYNVLIQSYFDYACLVWYPSLTENTKEKLQIMQNKHIRFCLRLENMHHRNLKNILHR